MPDPTAGDALNLLFVSHTAAHGVFKVGSHHLARELATTGHDVTHISTPLSSVHRALGRVNQAQIDAAAASPFVDADGVHHVVPRTPLPAGVVKYNFAALRVGGAMPTYDAIYIDQPLMWNPRLRSMTTRLIYRPTDMYPTGRKRQLQSRILAAADAVIATSQQVLADIGRCGVPTAVVPNGVEAGRFTNTEPRDQRRKQAIYVGSLDHRFDWEAVASIARSLPDWTLEIWGPGSGPQMPPNVNLRGPLAYDAVPAVLQQARIGILPLSPDPVNAGRSPMKLYEYLAAGLTVLTTETSTLGQNLGAGVYTYARSDQIHSTANDAARASKSLNAAGIEIARQNDWTIKAREVYEFTLRVGSENDLA